MNKLNDKKIEQMDNYQRKLSNALEKQLREKYNTKIEIGMLNVGYKADRELYIYIYCNQYDYKKVNVKVGSSLSVNEYIDAVEYALNNDKFTKHKASTVEVMVHKLIEENICETLCIYDGELIDQNNNSVCLYDITNVDYCSCCKKLNIENESGEKCVVDFEAETITYLE